MTSKQASSYHRACMQQVPDNGLKNLRSLDREQTAYIRKSSCVGPFEVLKPG